MISAGFILIPLYIYPQPGAWDPLFNAAKANPSVQFAAVVNPNSGPGAGSCPDANYINAIATLNAIPNIASLAYVHTATSSTCGTSGKDICVCSQPQSAVKANITTYQNWPKANCTSGNSKDIHIDGIFFDESPSNGTCIDYMRSLTKFAKSNLTQGNTVLFNAGSSVNDTYYSIADYINVLENNEAGYDSIANTPSYVYGTHPSQATFIIYGYASNATTEQKDVTKLLGKKNDGIAGLYITDLSVYSAFPTNWTGFVQNVKVALSS